MKRRFLTLCVLFGTSLAALAQNSGTDRTDSLYREFSRFVYTPELIAKQECSLDDFFLYYPLADKSWKAVPNAVDTTSGALVKATYLPDDQGDMFWSAAGEGGTRDLFHSRKEGEVWSVPEPLFDTFGRQSDEIYPMLSQDGKTLWFASDDENGLGGYDLYVSKWDERRQTWGEPANMGFPYSSQADDFLYMDDADGLVSVFASTRGAGRDSVWVYILEYDNMPLRRAVDDPDELRALLEMRLPSADGGTAAAGGTAADDGTAVDSDSASDGVTTDALPAEAKTYLEKAADIQALEDELDNSYAELDAGRKQFSKPTDTAARDSLASLISEGEAALPPLLAEIGREKAELQQLELDLLRQGIYLNTDSVVATDGAEPAATKTYDFIRRQLGEAADLAFAEPESLFDYSFQILPEGRYAEDQTLPAGVVYQIHYITLTAKATTAQLRGLSPVYETRQDRTGYYVYRVGLFKTYDEAAAKLPEVKKLGFKSASVVAFKDGESCKISEARAAESKPSLWQISIESGDGTLPAEVSAAIRQSQGKELAKSYVGGKVFYQVSTFGSKEEAEEFATLLRAAGAEKLSINEIQQ